MYSDSTQTLFAPTQTPKGSNETHADRETNIYTQARTHTCRVGTYIIIGLFHTGFKLQGVTIKRAP